MQTRAGGTAADRDLNDIREPDDGACQRAAGPSITRARSAAADPQGHRSVMALGRSFVIMDASVPLTIRLVGFSASVRTMAARDALRSVFDELDDHTDDTFVPVVQRALAATEPHAGVACLTILDGGTVCAFDGLEPFATLHRIGSAVASRTTLQFLTPKNKEMAYGVKPVGVLLERRPGVIPPELRDFRIEEEDGSAWAHWPKHATDAASLDRALAALVPLARATGHTALLVGSRFHRVVAGPDGAAHLPMTTVAGASKDDLAALKRIHESNGAFPAKLR